MDRSRSGLYFLILAVAAIAQVSADNCFHSKPAYLVKAFNIGDSSGNYSVSTEYWMRLDSSCDFVIDTTSRITWYSSDITVDY